MDRFRQRLQQVQQQQGPLTGSALEAQIFRNLPFQNLDDNELLAELPNGLLFVPMAIRRGIHPDIREDIDELDLPGSRYTQMVSYNVLPPLAENQELALQTLYQRIRDFRGLRDAQFVRIRMVKFDRGERLVRNRNQQARFSPEYMGTLQSYMRFRDTALFLFSSNEDIDFEIVTFYLDLDYGREERGGAGEGDESLDDFLRSKAGIQLIPRKGHPLLCGWMCLALYCVMVDERYNEYCRNGDSVQRMKSLTESKETWMKLALHLREMYGDEDKPYYTHPSCTQRWLKDYPEHRMVIVNGVEYKAKKDWDSPTIIDALEGPGYVKTKKLSYVEDIQKGNMKTMFMWMDRRFSVYTQNQMAHFHFIYNPNAFLKYAKDHSYRYFCMTCFKNFNDRQGSFATHKCHEPFCDSCSVYLPPSIAKTHMNPQKDPVPCSKCGIICYSETCKDIHESRCTRQVPRLRTSDPFCRGCNKPVTDANHACFIRPDPKRKYKKQPELEEVLKRYFVFDFESEFIDGCTVKRKRDGVWVDMDVDTHRVNFVAVQQLGTGSTWTFSSLDEFYEWLSDSEEHYATLLAHNMKGYDGRMLFNYLLDKGDPPGKCMWVGNKIMAMEILKGKWKVQDTLTHLSFALEQLPGIFGLDETEFKKGFFPYKFNTPQNRNYIGRLPDIKYFDPDMMRLEKKKAFIEWHANESQRIGDYYNFWAELEAYCISDVKILAKAIEVYITEGMTQNQGLNPMANYTIAAYAQLVYISFHMPEKSLVFLNDAEEDFARRALHGGRTDVRKMYKKWNHDDVQMGRYGVYQDVQSLYPTVQFYKPMPVGKPQVFKWGPNDLQPQVDEILSWFGFVECDLSVEKECFHPVVVAKDETGKLVADLKDKKKIVLTTPELQQAIDQGYLVTKVYEAHLYEQSKELFKSYIRTFLKLKIESSGMPKHIKTDDDWTEFYKYHHNVLGVDLSREGMVKNAGRKQLAKLMLNSLWGKFAERPHSSAYIATDKFDELMQLESLWDQGKIDITYRHMYRHGKYVLVYKYLEGKPRSDYVQKTNVAAAAFVTAWGALTLWGQMEKLGKRVLYHDTDSIIYERDPYGYNIPLGKYLGEWEDETGGLPIVEFVSIGPKTYAYKVQEPPMDMEDIDKLRKESKDFILYNNKVIPYKTVCKAKGFTLNAHNLGKINFSTMHDLLVGNVEKLQGTSLRFVYRRGESMHTEQELKEMKMVYDKGYVDDSFTVWPWGYDRFRTWSGPRRGWVADAVYESSQ